ncbi:Galactose oxidase, central domain, variant 2 [Balamuthia mandrillaris]
MFCVDLSRPLSSSTSSDRDSHSSIQTMLSHIQQLQQQNQSNKHERRAHCVLAGTKSDLQPRRVSNEQMGELCEWLNVDRWIDTSAKTGEGVEEAFAEALRLAEKEQRANIMLENEERTGLPTASRFRIKERASTMKEDMMTALEMARHFGDVEFTIHQKQEEQEQDKKEEQEEKEEAEDKHVSNIPANLVILLCRCPSLMKHMKEGEKQAVIKGVSAEVMRSLLQYIYSKTFPPDLSTDEKHIRQVMDAAKRFEIFSLVGLCKQMTNAKAEEDEDEEEEQDNVRKTFVHLVRSEKKERRREEEDLEEHFKMVVNASVYSDVKFLFPPQENNHDKEMKKTKKQHDKEHEEHYNDSQQRTIYAHKVILASRCSYFRSLFLGNFQEKEKDAFEVHDIPYDTFLTLLAFLYTDQLSFSSSSPSLCSSLELMVAADRYGVDRLVEKCCNCFIDGLDEENVVQVIKWSRELSLEQLKAACLQYMLRWMQLHPQSKKELEKKLDDATRQELRQCMPE